MSDLTLDHVLLTRFNVPSAGRESLIRAQEGWLRERVTLFERYCLPSVRRQDNSNFRWIIYFDPQSPLWLREWIESLAPQGAFTPIFRESISRAELVSDLRDVSGAGSSLLITTNLDNDDALAVDFISRIQRSIHSPDRQAIYLADGLILQEPNVYLQHDENNAFCSVAELWDEPVTAWVDWHNRLHLHMPVNILNGAPAWVQVIHGANVSNRVHGRLTRPSRYVSQFPVTIATLPEPNPLQFVAETLVSNPLRVVSTFLRSTAKSLILAMGGRQGLERLRDSVAATRHRVGMVVDSVLPSKFGRDDEQRSESSRNASR